MVSRSKVIRQLLLIKKGAYEAIFGLAMIAAISRTAIRIYRRQLAPDDFFLLLVVVCLGAFAGLFFRFKDVLFLEETIALDSSPFLNTFIEKTLWLQKLAYAFFPCNMVGNLRG